MSEPRAFRTTTEAAQALMPTLSSFLLKSDQLCRLEEGKILLVGQVTVDGAIVAVFAGSNFNVPPQIAPIVLPDDGLLVAGAVLIDEAWPTERPDDGLEYSALTPLRATIADEVLGLTVAKGGPVSFRNFDYEPWD